jgi:hypothetical protein
MLFKGLHERSKEYLDFIQTQLDMGLDAVVELPPRTPHLVSDTYNLHGLPVNFDPRVRVKEWKETTPGEDQPILVKEYLTPSGALRAEVRQTDDWRWGDHVPLFDDFIEPRSRKFLIETMDDLDPLRFLLSPPTPIEIQQFKKSVQTSLEFARQKGLLVAGGWGVGADTLGWLCGLTNMILLTRSQPQFIQTLLDLIAAWNRERMKVVLSEGIDLYIKRSWYENCDFWNPVHWKKFIQPILAKDADLAHQYGAKFGMIITSSAMPLIEPIIAAGVDVLIGVDPREYDLSRVAQLAFGKLCLWGGVNGHITVERGTPEQVAQEVKHSLAVMKNNPGFILSPVDNIRELLPSVEKNIQILIKTWKEGTSTSIS